ncbi:MAG: V-type ATP synthase subunit I [Lachnospiraceae bacterium]
MIEKMEFLTVTGPKDSLDRVIEKYLSKYEFQLENALTELKDVSDLTPYTGACPYRDSYNHSEEILNNIADDGRTYDGDMDAGTALQVVSDAEAIYTEYRTKQEELNDNMGRLRTYLTQIEPFTQIDYSIKDVLHFKFIRYGFGKMPKDCYEKFVKYVDSTIDAIFVKSQENSEYVWGAYFSPAAQYDKIDSIFASLHFTKFELPDQYDGSAKEVYNQISVEITELEAQLKKLQDESRAAFREILPKLKAANVKLFELSQNFDVRKMAACTSKHEVDFFILCGWMPRSQAKKFLAEAENEPDICLVEDEGAASTISTPPTKLKNFRLIKPFEMFTEMYGLPAYNELDPTFFIAVTYAFIFGVMFGDVGQGLCLFLGGFLLYKIKGMRLAAIIGYAGIFSTIFGFLYGSFFGFEDILPQLWLNPQKAMINGLPMMGNMNTILIVSIVFGMFLVLVTMIMHIINGIKARRVDEVFFDHNALAGFVFYLSFVIAIILLMTGNPLPGGIVLVVMFVIPLIIIALKEPLLNLVEKKSHIFPAEKGMFICQTFFEMFEVLLSYVSNTISFVRIGAFAISHGAMMQVVLMLAGAESGDPNWIVVVLGNILVSGLEGLIVGIQVLRLEYYEMFSRFYKGTGRPFKPYSNKKQ